jgi:hypothetical protein
MQELICIQGPDDTQRASLTRFSTSLEWLSLETLPPSSGWELLGTLQMGQNTHLVMWKEESFCYLLVASVASITRF